MSKRHGKSRQTNPNRARSKNNPDGKWNDPKTDWSEYNKDRRSEDPRIRPVDAPDSRDCTRDTGHAARHARPARLGQDRVHH